MIRRGDEQKTDLSPNLQLDGPIAKFLVRTLGTSGPYSRVAYRVSHGSATESRITLARRYLAIAVRAIAPARHSVTCCLTFKEICLWWAR